MACPDELRAQLIEPCGADAVRGPAVLFENFAQCTGSAAGPHGLLPVAARELARDAFDLDARRDFRRFQGGLVDDAARKETVGKIDAAHVQALSLVGFQALADDELGRTAADVDHQSTVGRGRQRMRDAQIDKARFFAAGNDLDRMSQCDLGLGNEFVGILRHSERRGADTADRLGRQPAQAFAEAVQAGQRARLGRLVEPLVAGEPAGEAHGLLQRVERIELVARYAGDFEAKGIGAEVDRGKGVVGFHDDGFMQPNRRTGRRCRWQPGCPPDRRSGRRRRRGARA